MIGHLRGTVRHKEAARGMVLVDAGGVGYEVFVSLQGLAEVPDEGRAVALWIHTHVREDAIELFGFPHPEERAVFRALLAVPGVGPRLALTVLGGMALSDLVDTIAARDARGLCKIPGIGKKTAERILLDLADKLPAGSGAASDPRKGADARAPAVDEAVSALVHAGFRRKQAESAVVAVCADAGDVAPPADELVRIALRRLVGRP